MTTMITGGAGLIGSYLARLLIEEGDKPILFDIAPVQGPVAEMKGRFVFEQGTLSHLPVIMDCIERHGIDRIFHLGGMLSLPSENNPLDAFDANVVGILNILEAARIKKMKQVVYASTIGISKTFGELVGRWYHRRFGLDFRGVRLPSIVGPGAKTEHMSIYNAWAIEYSIKGLSYILKCDPDTRCPVLYYKDAALSLKALASADQSRIRTRVYNIAGITPPFSARELVNIIEQRIPEARLSFKPDPPVVEFLRELGSLAISDECAQTEWGWKLSCPLETMVDDFIDEFEKHKSYFL
jgi:nucleoside-diphosphate-sugar epimerase